MKKRTRILSFVLAVMLSIPMMIIPSRAEDGVQYAEKDLHELLRYDDAVSAGHVNRLNDEESLNTLVFANADNTKTMYYYSEDIKYIDSDGSIHDKTNDLVYKKGEYVSRDNDIISRIPKDIMSGVSVSYEDIEITMTPDFTSMTTLKPSEFSEAKYEAEPKGIADSVTYSGVFGTGTSVRYTPTYSGLKEEIILPEYTGIYTFDFTVEAHGLVLVYGVPGVEENDDMGNVSMVDIGRWYFAYPDDMNIAVAEFSDIIIWDSAGHSTVGSLKCEEISDGKYTVTVNADRAFLEAKDTVYPVTVDPTIVVGVSSASGSNKYIYDTMLSATNQDKKYGSQTLLTVGGAEKGYILMAFPALEDMNFAASISMSKLISAELKLYCTGTGTASTTMYVNSANPKKENWEESTTTYTECGIGYNTSTNYQSSTSSVTLGTSVKIDVTKTVKGWYETNKVGTPRKGILIRVGSNLIGQSKYAYTFASSEYGTATRRPHLTLTFGDGMLVKIKNKGASNYLNVDSSSSSVGTDITTKTSDTSSGQVFRMLYDSAIDTYLLAPVCSNFGYGDYVGVNTSNKNVELTKSTGAHTEPAANRWKIKDAKDGTFYIISAYNESLYMMTSGTSSGSTVNAAISNGNDRQKWTFELIDDDGVPEVNVNLYVQARTDTCGLASMRMVLSAFSINKSETDLYNLTGAYSPTVGKICTTLNTLISGNGEYKYCNLNLSIYNEYLAMLRNLSAGYPVIVLIKKDTLSDTDILKYKTNGHYIVVSGLKYKSSEHMMYAIVKDPHYNYYGTYELPLDLLLSYSRSHPSTEGNGVMAAVFNK